MDQDLGNRNESYPEREKVTSRKTVKKSLGNSSRHQRSSQQQPGRYLCIDTRKDQVYVPKVRPNSSYTHNFSSPSTRSKHFGKSVSQNLQPKKNLKVVQKRTVQPDSHCKFKTTLAIEYVRDLLEENTANSRPISRRKSLKKNGQLKPLYSAGHLNLEPDVTKCLGIQNDRQKKTVTLEDGLEVREELVSPDIARFSSATKRMSQNTLTIDLRKLSLVDQSETMASDNSGLYEERREETDSEDEIENPKNTIIYKNSDLSLHDNCMSERHWSDYSRNHTIDDNDQGIEGIIDHTAVCSSNRLPDYSHNESDNMSDDCVHDIYDNSSVKYEDDYCHHIDHENVDNGDVNDKDDDYKRDDIDDPIGDIRDDVCDDIGEEPISNRATLNHELNKGEKSFNESNSISQDENIFATTNHETVSNDYAKRDMTESKNSLTLNEETKLITHEEKYSKPEVRYSQLPTSSRNSTTPSPTTPCHNYKTTIENTCEASQNENAFEEHDLKRSNCDELQHNANAGPFDDSCTTTTPLQSTADQDSIHVKDIWKALVDGGYAISRGEVSKYKVNSRKPRIKSAPARRRSSQSTNTFARDVPTRARSAINRDGERRSTKECFTELNEESDSQSTTKNPKVLDFVQAHGSETEARLDQKSLSCDQSSLEVVAVSKPVIKLLRKKIPLIPPFNFQINTIPKSGHYFYFAYGLNMNQKRLEIQLRCKTGVRYWGLLFGFKLLFNKKGTAEGGVGFPNIVHEPGFSVEGCVYELPLDCLPLLDTCVGFPKHYSRIIVPVWMCNSSNADKHGVAQHCVPAVVYIAQDEWVASDPTTLDTSFTWKQCVLGTDFLTSNYQTFLEGLNQKSSSNEYMTM